MEMITKDELSWCSVKQVLPTSTEQNVRDTSKENVYNEVGALRVNLITLEPQLTGTSFA